MKNPIHLTYQSFDNAMLYGANKVVQGYNWLTGGTKNDLARNLINAGAAANLVRIGYASGHELRPIYGVSAAITLGLAFFWNQKFQEVGEAEERTNSHVNVAHPFRRVIDYLAPVSLGCDLLVPAGKYPHDIPVFSSMNKWSLDIALYVMRAEPVAPSKSLLKRLRENLETSLAQPEDVLPFVDTPYVRTRGAA